MLDLSHNPLTELPGEIDQLPSLTWLDMVDDLGGRLARLEEERDFYKELLDSPRKRDAISPPNMGEDASDPVGPT